jgi:hypothetical protein
VPSIDTAVGGGKGSNSPIPSRGKMMLNQSSV